MVEYVHKLGEKEISKSMDVEEMVTEVEVTRNHTGKQLVWMIVHNVMPFRAKMRQRHLMQ